MRKESRNLPDRIDVLSSDFDAKVVVIFEGVIGGA
jgi:hypothetical protein